MQALRRLYSTIPDAAAAARTTSTPRAVRLRRLKFLPPVAPGQSDATPEGLTPTERTRYLRQQLTGDLMKDNGSEMSEAEWLERLNSRRTRLRGVRKVSVKGGAVEPSVVAQKIYLPNLIFRLTRNFTPAGQPYNPYEATFRVPQSVTKTDIRSYLSAVYGVQTTYIRTDNYMPTYVRRGPALVVKKKAYKRAVVGLVEPFYYPQATEDMTGEERKSREEWMENNFNVRGQLKVRHLMLLKLTRKGSPGWNGWSWRTGTARRSDILRRIAERRAIREELVEEAKSDIAEMRANTHSVEAAA